MRVARDAGSGRRRADAQRIRSIIAVALLGRHASRVWSSGPIFPNATTSRGLRLPDHGGLATSARAQLTPTAPPAAVPFPPLTKTVFPEEPKRSRTPSDTFVLEPAMSIELDDMPSGPAGFDQKTAYVPLGSGRVVAIDLDQATLKWSRDIISNMAPVVSGGLVVVAGDEQLAAFDAATGAERWAVPITGGFSAPPLVDSGWVVAVTADGTVIAIRAADGKALWSRAVGVKAAATPF